jgi:hypothetical protein
MTTPHLVPKVHPATRGVEADDPLELVAEPLPGDPDLMLACVVQEFAWMGWGADQLLELFRSPDYPALNQLLARYGAAEVRRRVGELLGRSGVFRVREAVADDPDPEDDEPELIQLTVRPRT